MKNFYFTFGTNPEFPYKNGYIIIKAKDYDSARNVFKQLFGVTRHGYLAFSFQYSEEEWNKIYSEWCAKYGEFLTESMLGPCHDKF